MRKKSPAKKVKANRAYSPVERDLLPMKLQVFHEIGKISRGQKSGYLESLSRLMTVVLKALNTNAGTLFLVDESHHDIEFSIVKGPAAVVKSLRGKRIPWGEGIVGHVIKTGKPYLSYAVSADKRWKKEFSSAAGYSTSDILCVPLRLADGRTLGAIQVINRKGGRGRPAKRYTEEDLDTLLSIADQVALVAENAALFHKYRERSAALAKLHSINHLLTSSLNDQDIREEAVKAVSELMDCERGSLYQYDAATSELFFDVVLGDNAAGIREIRLKMGEGVAGWVAENRQGVLIPDCGKDGRFTQKMDQKSKFKTRNMLCAPLVFRGELIGVLQAINRKAGTFSESDLLLFTDLANQVAIALKNAILYSDLRRTFYESVTALAEAIELRDPYTGGHTQRVRKYALAIGKELNLNEAEMEVLSLSAILHDIGKIGVADKILRKQGKLDFDEFTEMKKHPEWGFKILQKVPYLAMTYDGVLYHHERFDGKGYPTGKKGAEIPLFARIIAVADTFDAMTTNRPYRQGLDLDFVMKELKACAGSQFDKKVVGAFLNAFKKKQIVL